MGRVQRTATRERERKGQEGTPVPAGKKPSPSVLVRIQVVFSNLGWLIVCLVGAGALVLLFVLLRR